MKTFKLIFSVFAFALAAGAAFTLNARAVASSAFFKVDPDAGIISTPYTQVSPSHWCEASQKKCKRLYETDATGMPVVPLKPLAPAVAGIYHN